ncbi:hypothetical protein HDU96_011152, partial [Phlyctochytrium bullatum]
MPPKRIAVAPPTPEESGSSGHEAPPNQAPIMTSTSSTSGTLAPAPPPPPTPLPAKVSFDKHNVPTFTGESGPNAVDFTAWAVSLKDALEERDVDALLTREPDVKLAATEPTIAKQTKAFIRGQL